MYDAPQGVSQFLSTMTVPLTSWKRLNDSFERAVTSEGIADNLERWHLGQEGLATQTADLEREHPTYAMKNPEINNPRGTLVMTDGNVQLTMSTVCRCGKVCKNPTGLKIRRTKVGCMRKLVVLDTVPVLDTTPDRGARLGQSPHCPEPPSTTRFCGPLPTKCQSGASLMCMFIHP